MRFPAFVLILVGLCACLTDASMCQPYSIFKIDCNNCMCSGDGRQYSCTDNICPLNAENDEKYEVRLTKNGHRLLVPKNDAIRSTSDENGHSLLPNKQRYPRVPYGYPYINDEISPSKEETGNVIEDIDDINEKTEDISNDDYVNDVNEEQYPEK